LVFEAVRIFIAMVSTFHHLQFERVFRAVRHDPLQEQVGEEIVFEEGRGFVDDHHVGVAEVVSAKSA
jgi:hypothetical protein